MNQLGELSASSAVILTRQPTVHAGLRHWLEPAGWRLDCHDPAEDFLLSADERLALVLIDAAIDAAERANIVARIRATPGPVAGTPLLLLATLDIPAQNGVPGRIDLPLQRETALAVIEQWVGPLHDHAFRNLSRPHYRLVRFAGRASADRLLASFADHAESALAMLDRGEDVKRTAHAIAGLAGTLGYGELSRLWSAIERDETTDREEARTATRAVLDELKPLVSKAR